MTLRLKLLLLTVAFGLILFAEGAVGRASPWRMPLLFFGLAVGLTLGHHLSLVEEK